MMMMVAIAVVLVVMMIIYVTGSSDGTGRDDHGVDGDTISGTGHDDGDGAGICSGAACG